MTRLIWGNEMERGYEFGVDRGVFYPKGGIGVAWQGLVSVEEMVENSGRSMQYIDGKGYELVIGRDNFAAKISAMTYPDEFQPFDGYSQYVSQQRRSMFDFTFRTMQEGGHYKVHLVYNALAAPTQRNDSSINPSLDISLFSWNLTTRPEIWEGVAPTAHLVVDSKYANPGLLAALTKRLYGDDASEPDMPTPAELLAIFEDNFEFIVTDHGDGTATISGPDDNVFEVSPGVFRITRRTVVQTDFQTVFMKSD